MDRQTTRRLPTVAGCLLLLLVFCLADCASEQGIIGRISKVATIGDRANSWRSQRGGSCLSYGHSCWGAHGKRSGRTMVPTTLGTNNDWYLARLLRRMAGLDTNNIRQLTPMENSDLNAIFRVEEPNETTNTNRLAGDNEEMASLYDMQKTPNAIPMLDDASLAKAKLVQIMRDASETN